MQLDWRWRLPAAPIPPLSCHAGRRRPHSWVFAVYSSKPLKRVNVKPTRYHRVPHPSHRTANSYYGIRIPWAWAQLSWRSTGSILMTINTYPELGSAAAHPATFLSIGKCSAPFACQEPLTLKKAFLACLKKKKKKKCKPTERTRNCLKIGAKCATATRKRRSGGASPLRRHCGATGTSQANRVGSMFKRVQTALPSCKQ